MNQSCDYNGWFSNCKSWSAHTWKADKIQVPLHTYISQKTGLRLR